MKMKNHITEKLSAYLNHELPKDERQAIAEHLLQCETCRKEHDEIKFGATLAGNLKPIDAPENTWTEIKNALDEKENTTSSVLPQIPFFNFRGVLATAIALLIVSVLAIVVYLNLSGDKPQKITRNEQPMIVQENQNSAIAAQNSTEIPANSNTEIVLNSANTNNNSTTQIPAINSDQAPQKQTNPSNESFWKVETISGVPVAGSQKIAKNGILEVGDILETDSVSRARVQVANIGQVEVEPNSRVQLVKTESTEHRLSLERGTLKAKILAPPRLFIVDTPSAVAVDLGCEYKLEVDKNGNSRLHVTMGFVALENGGRESIVPAGAVCLTRRGKGIGTPFFDDVSPAFQAALTKFDFENAGSQELQTIIKESRSYDTLTLWHLLSKAAPNERGKIFDALAAFAKPPAGVTREGIMKSDKKMLQLWRKEIENLWFE